MPGSLCMPTVVICMLFTLGLGEVPRPSEAASQQGQAKVTSANVLQAISRTLGASAGEAFRSAADRELPDLQAQLQPVLGALPSTADGRFGPTAVRYALHRLFLQRRGWLIKGLDPQGQAWNGTSPSNAALLLGLPEAVRGTIEAELMGPGLRLEGVATLAALLQHQVHEKEEGRLRSIYDMVGLPQSGAVSQLTAGLAMELYATAYVLGRDLDEVNPAELMEHHRSMAEIYPNWPAVQMSLQKAMQRQVHEGSIDFGGAEHVVQEMTDEFFRWEEPECQAMKAALMKMEDRGTGRIALADFYNQALHEGKWQLSESEPYLRQLGALDESNPRNLRVIIPNYLYGASNCLATSDHLSVCCVSECEGILGALEQSLRAPQAPAADVAAQIAAVPSSTVPANRSISRVMLHRLNAIAASHGGQVPLHGRLFAQWLHHAYPRECPYPHLSGRTRPLHADDWMKITGQDVSASPSAMAEHAGTRPSTAPKLRGPLESAAWSYEEELFVPSSAGTPAGLMMVHGTVYVAALAVMAFGFVLAKMARLGRKVAQSAQSATKASEPALYAV